MLLGGMIGPLGLGAAAASSFAGSAGAHGFAFRSAPRPAPGWGSAFNNGSADTNASPNPVGVDTSMDSATVEERSLTAGRGLGAEVFGFQGAPGIGRAGRAERGAAPPDA